MTVSSGPRLQCLGNGRVADGEIIIVTGAEMSLASALECDGAIAVQFDLFCGVRGYVALTLLCVHSDVAIREERNIIWPAASADADPTFGATDRATET
jgi:hypothetical protein